MALCKCRHPPFSRVPTASDEGLISVNLIAKDLSGAIALDSFSISTSSIASDNSFAKDKAQIYRLYIAQFGRMPDERGFRFWVAAHDNFGLSCPEMATRFFIRPRDRKSIRRRNRTTTSFCKHSRRSWAATSLLPS